ncbi:MAG TPA: type II toxin-antitoxin system RelE/ParE family toxin [Pseudomonadota bacterium]|jgi:toxin ParE1/3/4|nr:type II toxin-antitoxin system RelE/ParE family toxin [Pseudomonadota bacterium]
MKVFWTPSARRRLKEIEAYIARENSADVAREVVVRILQRTLTLEQHPSLGTRLRHYADEDIRELLERPYRVIFRAKPEQVEIIAVLHYRQLLPSDLQGLDAEIGRRSS